MRIVLLKAHENDRAFFTSAHHLAYRNVVESMFDWDQVEQDKLAESEFDQSNPHIISYEGKFVGVVGWKVKRDNIWFGPIYVLPEFQCNGIGSSVVKELVSKSKELCLPLRLRTLRNNTRAKKL